MKQGLFDLDVQVKSVAGVGTDTVFPNTAVCITVPTTADCDYNTKDCTTVNTLACNTLHNCVSYNCPTL